VQLDALMANEYLGLRLRTATQTARMRRPVSTVAPTELIEPTAFLEGNELVTLAGIAMNFQDSRTWDAYVERLAHVPVAGIVFNSGIAHAAVPSGLVDAGNKFDVPVLEVSPPVNILQVHRLVNDTLQSENNAVLRTSLELADACAELEARGTTVLELLGEIRSVVGGEVGLIDSQGRMVASRPSAMDWHLARTRTGVLSGDVTEHIRHLNPVRGRGQFSIAVRSPKSAAAVDALLGPVGSIVSLHLNSTAEQYGEANDGMRALVEQLRQPHGDTLRYTNKLMRAAGFDTRKPTMLVTARTGTDNYDAWRMRLHFAELFPVLGITETGGYLFVIGQDFDQGTVTRAVVHLLAEIAPRRPAIVTDPLHGLGSIRAAMLASPQQLERVTRPSVARRFDLPSVLATALTSDGIEQALSFLRPLLAYDRETDSELMRTLQAYLGADGSPTKTAAALFIHRNSLSYRLNRIGDLLGISLHTLEGKTTCTVALAVWDMHSPAAGAPVPRWA
jgi:purine catabolism regulator